MLIKYLFATLTIATLTTRPALAQTPAGDGAAATSQVKKPSRDFLMLQFTYDSWSKLPDSIKIGGIGRGFNGYVCYDFPIRKSNFSFAAGIGIGTSNIYLDNQEAIFTDTGTLGDQVRFVPERQDLKRFKITTAYLEAPFELRYFGNKDNRNKGFKAAIGFRAGTLVGAHTKDRRTVEGVKVADKIDTRRYFEKWRFAGTLRLGYGNFSIFGAYNINSLFKENNGPQVVPYSVGLCITGL